MASRSRSLFRWYVTTCGFIGMSVRVPRSSMNLFQLSMRFCDFLRNESSFLASKAEARRAEHRGSLRPSRRRRGGAGRSASGSMSI